MTTEKTNSASASPNHTGLRARLFTSLITTINVRYERWMAPRKQDLLGGLRGSVLEIGPGAGVNLRYYAAGVHWIGIEPNPYMQNYLRKEAEKRGLNIDLRDGTAERIDLPDRSVDAVVGTLVLCSVPDITHVLKQIQRVLKPGGKYIFIEHVAAPRGTSLRRVQRFARPLVKFFAEGCHSDRETWNEIAVAGFRDVKIDHFRAPLPIFSPHISGVAIP